MATHGGYVVNGTWRFASGAKHATWLGGHCKVYEADGTARMNTGGGHVLRTALFRREQASIADDWHVMGLRGTRSEGYTVDDLHVESRLTLDRETPEECRLDATLYKFPTTSVYASVFSGSRSGLPRHARRSRGARGHEIAVQRAYLDARERSHHTRLAELEARLGAARAYQRETIRDVGRSRRRPRHHDGAARPHPGSPTTYAIDQATEVSEQVYRLAGSTAIFEDHAFERRFRDAYAVSQQMQGRYTNFETVGRFMLGLDIETIFM